MRGHRRALRVSIPERLLNPQVRALQSAWGFVEKGVQERFAATLSADLKSGAWNARYGAWRQMPSFEGSLHLITGWPSEA